MGRIEQEERKLEARKRDGEEKIKEKAVRRKMLGYVMERSNQKRRLGFSKLSRSLIYIQHSNPINVDALTER